MLLFAVLAYGQTPTTLWSYELPDKVNRTSPAIASDGTVYIACDLSTREAAVPPALPDPNFFAINSDGTLKWSTSISESNFTKPDAIESSPSINADGSIYMGGKYSRIVFRLNAVTGDTIRTRHINTRQRYTAPVFKSDGSVYICGYDKGDRGLRSLSADLTTENWIFGAGSKFNSTPAVGSDGTIYAASTDGNIYAINPDGTEKWSAAYGSWAATAIAIGTDGSVYLAGETATGGVLVSYKPNDGSENWSIALAMKANHGGPVIADDGTIYLGGAEGRLRAYDADDGSEVWSYPAAANPALAAIEVAPAIDNNGNIYFGTTDGMFYVLDDDGAEAYTPIDLGDEIKSSAAIASDGKIYIAATDDAGVGKLFALQTTATGLASGDWPMYVGNIQHTGNVNAVTLSTISNSIENFRIYPNPVNNGELYISTLLNDNKSIQIFNVLGKEVYSKNSIANEKIEIGELTTGIYILKVVENDKVATTKLIIK